MCAKKYGTVSLQVSLSDLPESFYFEMSHPIFYFIFEFLRNFLKDVFRSDKQFWNSNSLLNR